MEEESPGRWYHAECYGTTLEANWILRNVGGTHPVPSPGERTHLPLPEHSPGREESGKGWPPCLID